MNNIIYLVGLVVVVLAILASLGLLSSRTRAKCPRSLLVTSAGDYTSRPPLCGPDPSGNRTALGFFPRADRDGH
jgi:hypothetical protein